MKKNMKGAFICLLMVALMGLCHIGAGVANAAETRNGVYAGTLTDNAGTTGKLTFKVQNSVISMSVLLPNTAGGIDNGGGFVSLKGAIDANGAITTTPVTINGRVLTFVGNLGVSNPLNDDLFDAVAGTWTYGNLVIAGAWNAQQTNPAFETVSGLYRGTFAKIDGTMGTVTFIVDFNAGTVAGSFVTTKGVINTFTQSVAGIINWRTNSHGIIAGVTFDYNALTVAGLPSTIFGRVSINTIKVYGNIFDLTRVGPNKQVGTLMAVKQ